MSVNVEMILQILAIGISMIVLIKGIFEYTKAQKWKKAEFVSKEVKEFFADFDVKRAMILLDWNANELPLKDGELDGKTKFFFTDNLILTALHTHKEMSSFTNEEAIIKGIFDIFFDKLATFDNYIKTGLINSNDIKPYLNYWIEILADPKNSRKGKNVKDKIWTYIGEYGYSNVASLCEKFGFNPPYPNNG